MKLLLNFLFLCFSVGIIFAQTKVHGYIKGKEGKVLENATVTLLPSNIAVQTDKIGYYQFKGVKSGEYTLNVFKTSYLEENKTFVVANEKSLDLGEIQLVYEPSSVDLGIISLTDDELDSGESTTQSGVGLLQSSKDAFSRTAAFELGAYWFRPRGTDNRYMDVLFNGVPMSKQDNGRIEFSNWGGLNDVTRYPEENVENNNPSVFTFGNLGGVTAFNTRASNFRKGTSVSYSYANRSYNQRVMATYNSGMSKRGWAFSVSGSRRWAEEGVIDGTYYDASALFLSAEKKINDKHSLNLTVFGAPRRNASNSPNTQEVYDLAGKNYNAYWGWQEGEKRSERVRSIFEPVAQLQHYWKIGKKSDLNTTVSYQMGEDSRSRLERFHANSPSPTYYGYLPSDGEFTAEEWLQNNQINWDYLYQTNHIRNNDPSMKGAGYYLVEDVNQDKTLNVNSHFSTQFQSNWKFNLNFNYQNLVSDNFRRVKDLLGARYAANLDGFGGDASFNIDESTYEVKEGERIQYSYLLNRQMYSLNASTELDLDKWKVIVSAFGTHTSSERDGKFRHHSYATDNLSKGKSDEISSWDVGIKANITYKLNGRNYFVYNGSYFTLPKTLSEIFFNARANNKINPFLTSEVINSNEVSFINSSPNLKIRATAYLTSIKNATEIQRYYTSGGDASGMDNFVTEILNDVDKKHQGAELAIEWKISSTLTATGVASYGDYTYDNNPDLYTASDETIGGSEYRGQANIKGLKISRSPQEGYSLGLRYSSPQYWWAGATANYITSNYLGFSSFKYTDNFVTNPATGDPFTDIDPATLETFLKQQEFEGQFMMNASVGKSFKFGKYRLGLSVGVNNVLNNRDYVTGGFEQARNGNYNEVISDQIDGSPRFSPKLWYDRGRSFFANVYLRF